MKILLTVIKLLGYACLICPIPLAIFVHWACIFAFAIVWIPALILLALAAD